MLGGWGSGKGNGEEPHKQERVGYVEETYRFFGTPLLERGVYCLFRVVQGIYSLFGPSHFLSFLLEVADERSSPACRRRIFTEPLP